MYNKKATIKSVIGLHARPATLLVKLASTFKSKLTICFEGNEIDMKSMWSVLGGGIKGGSTVMVKGEGEDEIKAVEAVVALIENVED